MAAITGEREERRSAPRAAFAGVALARVLGRQVICVAGDLSEGGISLFPQDHRAMGGPPFPPLQVTFVLPSLMGWVRMRGTVVHRTEIDQRVVWGVRFESPPTTVRAALRRYVRARGRSASPPHPPAPSPTGDAMSPLPVAVGRPTRPLRPAARGERSPHEEPTRAVDRDVIALLQEICADAPPSDAKLKKGPARGGG